MTADPTPQPPVDTAAHPMDQVDPHGYLQLQMRVIGGHSAALGKVESFERDATTGVLESVTVRHGMFGNKRTVVPANKVKWVNQDSVVLELTRDAFKRLGHDQGAKA